MAWTVKSAFELPASNTIFWWFACITQVGDVHLASSILLKPDKRNSSCLTSGSCGLLVSRSEHWRIAAL